MKRILSSCLAVTLSCSAAMAQIGIFDANINIGDPLIEGVASFDDGTYTVESVGASLGRDTLSDQFHFVYTEMSGSFVIEGDIFPLVDPGRGGFMIRQDLDADSKHVSWMRVSGTFGGSNTNAEFGSMFPTIRSAKGGGTIEDGDPEPGGFTDDNIGLVRIERIGNSFHLYTLNTSDEWVYVQTEVVPMDDPVFVGIAATADNDDAFGEFEFQEVQIIELPFNVVRDLPTDEMQPGASLTGVTLTASAREGETVSAVVNEVPPRDATVSNVTASGGAATTNADGSITWTLDGFNGEAILTYDLVLGNRQSSVWQGTFDDGVNLESYVGGESILPKVPSFGEPPEEPVEVDPDGVTLIQVENFRLFNPDQTEAFGLGIDPRTNSGITVMNVGGSSSEILEYPINITEAGTYYFFGQTRGEDGNSDSWHFEVDLPPAGDNSTRWDSGSGKSFIRGYVSSNDPSLDPRPFDLEPGEHFIMIANREDSAQIDWIAVTQFDNLNLDEFNDITGEFAEPVPFENVNVANPTPKDLVDGEAFCEAEDGYLVVTPPDGTPHFTIFEDPAASGGLYVVNSVNSTGSVTFDNRIDYYFNITDPGTYRFIARTRTPSGSDDSFWVGMDNEELVVSSLDDAFSGSGIFDDSFHNSWIETNNIPDQSWELDAGVHVLNLYVREDGTQIDWLLITNNLDQDPEQVEPPNGTSVIEYMLH